MTMRVLQQYLLTICIVQLLSIPHHGLAAASTPSSRMILRIRLADGSMEKIQVEQENDNLSLGQILSKYPRSADDSVQVGPKIIEDDSLSIASLGLKHGSLITIQSKAKKAATKPSFALDHDADKFQPFPDLHKNYHAAVRARARNRSGGSSFGDLSNLHASLHVVEPQPEGPLSRVYMCHKSAARFHASCTKEQQRAALLLGTIQRERIDLKPKKVRTSISSKPTDADFCQVAKVHVVYEPPQTKGNAKMYDATSLLDRESMKDVLKLADYLGLQPVGWIFTCAEDRHNQDGLPVWAADLQTGAQLQIAEMQARGRTEGSKFVTLAMDAATGATEAFGLSNVAVQMVAEGMLMADSDSNGRLASTQHSIVVDGRETTTLDTVLCLVNTALLSHDGLYASSGKAPTKKNGSLTAKTKKALVATLAAGKDDSELLTLLSEFRILLALDKLLQNDEEMEALCLAVRKYARGQKQGTAVSSSLKRKLTTMLASAL